MINYLPRPVPACPGLSRLGLSLLSRWPVPACPGLSRPVPACPAPCMLPAVPLSHPPSGARSPSSPEGRCSVCILRVSDPCPYGYAPVYPPRVSVVAGLCIRRELI